jgi:hypothetical protein
LFHSGQSGSVSPERVVLFGAMVLVSCVFVVRMIEASMREIPDLGPCWLLLFGSSCAVYLGMKAFRTFSGKKSNGETI